MPLPLSKLIRRGPRAWLMLPGVLFWLLRYHCLPPVKGEIRPLTPGPVTTDPTRVESDCGFVEQVAGALPFTPSCLTIALACRRVMHPVPLQLHIGGRKDGDAFEAHAWLTFDGRTVCGGGRESDYSPFRALDDLNRRNTLPSNRTA